MLNIIYNCQSAGVNIYVLCFTPVQLHKVSQNMLFLGNNQMVLKILPFLQYPINKKTAAKIYQLTKQVFFS